MHGNTFIYILMCPFNLLPIFPWLHCYTLLLMPTYHVSKLIALYSYAFFSSHCTMEIVSNSWSKVVHIPWFALRVPKLRMLTVSNSKEWISLATCPGSPILKHWPRKHMNASTSSEVEGNSTCLQCLLPISVDAPHKLTFQGFLTAWQLHKTIHTECCYALTIHYKNIAPPTQPPDSIYSACRPWGVPT